MGTFPFCRKEENPFVWVDFFWAVPANATYDVVVTLLCPADVIRWKHGEFDKMGMHPT